MRLMRMLKWLSPLLLLLLGLTISLTVSTYAQTCTGFLCSGASYCDKFQGKQYTWESYRCGSNCTNWNGECKCIVYDCSTPSSYCTGIGPGQNADACDGQVNLCPCTY